MKHTDNTGDRKIHRGDTAEFDAVTAAGIESSDKDADRLMMEDIEAAINGTDAPAAHSNAASGSAKTGRTRPETGHARPKREPEPKKSEKKPAPEQKSAAKKKKSSGKTRKVLIIVVIVLAVIIAAVTGFGIYVSNTDTIFPNVSVCGAPLGGMTKAEAAAKLQSAGWDADAESETVTILLPMDHSISVSAQEADAVITSADAAMTAYDYGHSGNLFSNLVKYLGCLGSGVQLDVDVQPNENVISKKVDSEAEKTISDLTGSGVKIDEDVLLLVKGAKNVEINTTEITDLIVKALKERNYTEIEYEAKVEEAGELDIEALYESVHTEAADAYYDADDGVVDEVIGIDFNKSTAQKLWNQAASGDTVEIALTITEPKLTAKDVEEMLFRDVLGTTTTSIAGSTANRINNIKLAAASLNGVVLEPGEQFSYNDTLGERTSARGYKSAGAYSGGQVVQELGGGICQGSSTLYCSVLLANLKIVDRSCHYFGVGYLPVGLDATVSWGGPDFKFMNNRDYPIRIEASVDEDAKTLTISIIGTDVDGSYVEMTYAQWLVYKNEEYPEIATGYKAATYRWVYDKDGNVISKELEAYSEYHYHEENIVYPSPSVSPSDPAGTDTPSTDAPVITEPPAATEPVTPTEPGGEIIG